MRRVHYSAGCNIFPMDIMLKIGHKMSFLELGYGLYCIVIQAHGLKSTTLIKNPN